jgi:hypothetical protein
VNLYPPLLKRLQSLGQMHPSPPRGLYLAKIYCITLAQGIILTKEKSSTSEMMPQKWTAEKDARRQLFSGVDFDNDSSAFTSQTSILEAN